MKKQRLTFLVLALEIAAIVFLHTTKSTGNSAQNDHQVGNQASKLHGEAVERSLITLTQLK